MSSDDKMTTSWIEVTTEDLMAIIYQISNTTIPERSRKIIHHLLRSAVEALKAEGHLIKLRDEKLQETGQQPFMTKEEATKIIDSLIDAVVPNRPLRETIEEIRKRWNF